MLVLCDGPSSRERPHGTAEGGSVAAAAGPGW